MKAFTDTFKWENCSQRHKELLYKFYISQSRYRDFIKYLYRVHRIIKQTD